MAKEGKEKVIDSLKGPDSSLSGTRVIMDMLTPEGKKLFGSYVDKGFGFANAAARVLNKVQESSGNLSKYVIPGITQESFWDKLDKGYGMEINPGKGAIGSDGKVSSVESATTHGENPYEI